jgi:hypothetical protein
MSGAYVYIPSLGATETVNIDDSAIKVSTVSYAIAHRSVTVAAGPLSLFATPAEAIALGDALIRMAHHYTAALAEYQAAQGETAVQS